MSTFDTTEHLVLGAQRGEHDACEQLFRRYLPRVVHMVAARLGVSRHRLPAEAEDLAQEALLRALGGLGAFSMRSPGAFAAWMETIVLNAVRKNWRRETGPTGRLLWQRYGDVDLRESFFASGVASPSELTIGREQEQAIERALEMLPAMYRQALVGRYVSAMDYVELASYLGRSEVNCRKIVQRALDLLRVAVARNVAKK